MKRDLNYEEVPRGYLNCLNTQCLRSTDCLRFKVAMLANKAVSHFPIVNPAYINDQTECRFFHPEQLVRYAFGITHLYDKLPHTKYSRIKKKVHEYFEHNRYYRIYNKQLPIKPADQAFIRDLFLKEGIETEPLFDEYVEQYEFFPSQE